MTPKLIEDDEISMANRRLFPEEFADLEASCLKNGFQSPVIAWLQKGGAIAVVCDGHHRLEIARKHKLPLPKVVYMEFACKDEAIAWVKSNQSGRRNWTDEEVRFHRGKEYLDAKKPQGGAARMLPKGQSELLGGAQEIITKTHTSENGLETPKTTAAAIAEKHDVSESTIKRDAKFAAQVLELPPEDQAEVMAGKKKLPKPRKARKVRVPKNASDGWEPPPNGEKTENAKPTKSGQMAFDNGTLTDSFGKLVRIVEECGKARGRGPRYKAMSAAMETFLAEWKAWMKEMG
jgi:hypothetical protein